MSRTSATSISKGATNLFSQTAIQTIANTAVETSMLGAGVGSKTLRAAALVPGKGINISGGGIFSSLLVPGNVTIAIKIGGVTIATGIITNLLANAASNAFSFYADIVCITAGVAGTVMVNAVASYETGVLVRGFLALNKAGVTTVIDTTIANVIDIMLTWATMSPSNTITTTTAIIQAVN